MNKLSEKERILRFKMAFVNGLRSATFKQIISECGSIENFMNRGWEKLPKKMNKEKLEKVMSQCDEIVIDRNLEKLEKNSIKFVVFGDQFYPFQLLNVNDPPKVLYYKGSLESVNWDFCFSVVGTRANTDYGKEVVERFVPELVHKGFCIVSGMAYGIDSMAHQSAIDTNGKTIAVLGTSLDNPAPKGNLRIYNQILDTGGVVFSELLPGEEFGPYTFPSRNRIIAGISIGTLVVEAPKKSGALITASMAFGYSRQVFAVPADITRFKSIGTNGLIRDNRAKLVCKPEDIFIEYGFLEKNRKIVDKNFQLINRNVKLTDMETQIVDYMKINPVYEDELVEKFDTSPNILLASLTKLELEGIVEKGEDGRYKVIL
jgi:DNA processing protein